MCVVTGFSNSNVSSNGNSVIRTVLQDLRGGGFNTSLTISGVNIVGQKVVAFEDVVVFTVNNAGVARATVIADIQSVDF